MESTKKISVFFCFGLVFAHIPYVQITPWKRISMATEKIGDQKLCFLC